MKKLRISAIRYANTFPLNFGLRESGIEKFASIDIDHPAECARKLKENIADIGLVPVAEIRNIKNSRIISKYCIGTNSPVRTVLLVSNSPFGDIDTIFLDYRSRTSVKLSRILAAEKWKREFIWKSTDEYFNFKDLPAGAALVIIGDQCFELEDHYRYKTDLATEWKELTGLPFVFACWVANKELDSDFIKEFDKALEFGINNIDRAIGNYEKYSTMPANVLKTYLTENIDYDFNKEKKQAMDTFFAYIDKLLIED